MGENIKLRKKDHSSPIFLFFPIFSETTREKIYQVVKIMLIQMMFIVQEF